jgi:hypothetical protein
VPRILTAPYALPVVRDWAEAYASETGGVLPFDLEAQAPTAAIGAAEASSDRLLIYPPPAPEGWFVTPVGRSPVTFILHPDVDVSGLRPIDLENLFLRRTADWSALGGSDVEVQPVMALPGEPIRLWFESEILHGSPLWPGTWLAPTPEAMIELVSTEPGAIGIVLGTDVPEAVRIARISGRLPILDPGSGAYPYVLELLAFAPAEPTGGVRDFLVWLPSR